MPVSDFQFRLIVFGFLTAIINFSVFAQPAESPEKSATPWTAEEIRLIDRSGEIVAVLENGLTVIVRENHDFPIAAARFYIRAGSIYENPRLGAGLTHLLEHLLAGGATQKRSEEDSRKLIQQVGGHHNAYTTKDHTCYFLTVPAQHVGTALSLLADWIVNPTFPEDAFKREWGVVQRELEMNATDPDHQLYQQFETLRYQVHPAQYPIIGYQQIVQQMTREDILDYYHTRYVPDNTVFVLVGDFQAEEMFQSVKKEFANFNRRPIREIVLPEEPPMTGPRELTKVMPSMKGPARIILGFETVRLQHPDLYALDTLANVIGRGKSSRLYRALCEEKQIALDVDASSDTPTYVTGTFCITSELAVEKISDLKKALAEQIDRIKKTGVTADELDRAKSQLRVQHFRSLQTVEQQADSMGRDFLTVGDAHFSDRYIDNMQRVTTEDVKLAAEKYLLPDKQITVILTPTPPAAAAGETSAEGQSLPVKKIVLDNGLTVLLKARPNTGLVNVRLAVRGGLIEETPENNGITNMMTQTELRGSKNYTSAQIDDFFDRAGGTLAAGCDNNAYSFVAETMKEDFSKAFDIFADVALRPTFADDELAKQKKQELAALAQIANSWHYSGVRFFREKFFAKSPYVRIWQGRAESLQTLTHDQLAAFHQHSTVACRAVLAIFGDIDPAAAESLARKYFDPMPKGSPLNLDQFLTDSPPTEPRFVTEKTAKNGAVIFVGFPGMKLVDVQHRYPMEIVSEIIGSNTGWLHETLRGKQLVYYAWLLSLPGLLPGYIAATGQCEADKAPLVLDTIKQLLGKAAGGEISDDEIAAAKNNRINAEILQKQTTADLAAAAATDELFGFGYDWSDHYADRILAVTAEQVRQVAHEYFTAPPTVAVISSDPDIFSKPTQLSAPQNIQEPAAPK
jgi:zinc protease